MKKKVRILTYIIIILIPLIICSAYDYSRVTDGKTYSALYFQHISSLETSINKLEDILARSDLSTKAGRQSVYTELYACRKELKKSDFWTRYFEADTYRKLNGPLPVEWETEVFEKIEKPYKRKGYGLSLLEIALDSNITDKETLKKILLPSIFSVAAYKADTVTHNLNNFSSFFLANRLFLLNLAAIYTTGFECPNNDSIISELQIMLADVGDIYKAYNTSFKQYPLPDEYLNLYASLLAFVNAQPKNFLQFDQYTYIRSYINPLFALNQQYIHNYQIVSSNLNDYTLNNDAISIFDKNLYAGQNTMGIYSGVTAAKVIAKIKETGKMLFYDPILSGNNERSCASCHKPTEHFTDTALVTAPNFDKVHSLPRNTPSLLNVIHNHLLMNDGKHISLQNQARGVITSPTEMGSIDEETVLTKVMSCPEYRKALEYLKKYTYKSKEVTFEHIISAITAYEGDLSNFTSPFDDAMNKKTDMSKDCQKGFNLFMGKAQCGTCHYIPEFSGIRPPYVSSEFEVLGVPADTNYSSLSADSGRADVFMSVEMLHAFRTNTIRNSGYTKPYMHNGVFNTIKEVINFYNAGGGAGKGLNIPNQTLSSQQLHLTKEEIVYLIVFINSLDENIPPQAPPDHIPLSKNTELNTRKMNGKY